MLKDKEVLKRSMVHASKTTNESDTSAQNPTNGSKTRCLAASSLPSQDEIPLSDFSTSKRFIGNAIIFLVEVDFP